MIFLLSKRRCCDRKIRFWAPLPSSFWICASFIPSSTMAHRLNKFSHFLSRWIHRTGKKKLEKKSEIRNQKKRRKMRIKRAKRVKRRMRTMNMHYFVAVVIVTVKCNRFAPSFAISRSTSRWHVSVFSLAFFHHAFYLDLPRSLWHHFQKAEITGNERIYTFLKASLRNNVFFFFLVSFLHKNGKYIRWFCMQTCVHCSSP